MSGKGRAIDTVESESRREPVGPLEVVEQAPHEVPTDVHAVIDGPPDAPQDLGDVGDALGVVLGGDPTLGQEDGKTGDRRGPPGTVLDSLWPVLVAHLGDGNSGLVGSLAFGAEVHTRVALDTDEVVALRSPHEPVFQDLLSGFEHLFSARVGHHLVHRQRQAHRKVTWSRPKGVDGETMGSHDVSRSRPDVGRNHPSPPAAMTRGRSP